jgi:hypothetical protein
VRIGVVGEQEADQPADRDVEGGARREERGVHEAAFDDHLDVAQPVAHDRAGERQRHQAEWHRGQLQRERRVGAERPRQRVADRERADAEQRPPADPAQLTASGQRRDLAKRARQRGHRRHRAQEQVDRLGAVEHVERTREERVVRRSARHDDDAAGAEQEAGPIHPRQQATCAARGPPRRPVREHDREVEQQWRQQRHRDRIAPVEDPVEPIERAVEREGERAEERDAQPEEVQRRFVEGAAQPHRGAHDQREQADRRQHEVERAWPRSRRQRDVERLLRTKPDQGIGEPRPVVSAVLILDDVRWTVDRLAVDGDQQITLADPRRGGRRVRRDLDGGQALGLAAPEHAILDFVPTRAHRDIRDPERDQDGGHPDGERRAPPRSPPYSGTPIRARRGHRGVRHI